jgi:hypothetical protein
MTETATKTQECRLYKVKRGTHSEGYYPKGHPWAGKPVIYNIGEIVESKSRLEKFNSPGELGPKFQRIYDPNMQPTDKIGIGRRIAEDQERAMMADDGNGPHGPNEYQPQLPDDGLESLSMQDLRKIAKEENLQIPQGCTKEDAMTIIRQAGVPS